MVKLDRMTNAQLDALAKELGVDMSGCETKAEKVAQLAGKVEGEIIEVESMGVTATVRKSAFDDFELMGWLGEMNDGNIFAMPLVIKRIFGDDWSRIANELKGDDKHLTTTKASTFFKEVMEQIDAKN